jgi:hypothetical protein
MGALFLYEPFVRAPVPREYANPRAAGLNATIEIWSSRDACTRWDQSSPDCIKWHQRSAERVSAGGRVGQESLPNPC